MHRLAYLLLATTALLAAPVAAATRTLKNDGWSSGGQAYFQQGFALGERAGVVFVPEAGDLPATLRSVELLFGGGSPGIMRTVTLLVWTDGGTAPGTKLYEADFQLTSADDAINSLDLGEMAPTIDGPFWVALQFGHAGFPSVARDADGLAYPDRNWIYATDGNWYQSQVLGVSGDWIIRATLETGGTGGTPDGGTGGTPDGGGPGPTDGGTGGRPDGGGAIDAGMGQGLFLTRITPTSGPADADTPVAILGRGFTAETTFRLGPHWLEAVEVDSPTAATAVVPAGLPPDTYDLIAQAGPAQYVFPSAFTVVAEPSGEGGGCGCAAGAAGSGRPGALLLLLLVAAGRGGRRTEARQALRRVRPLP
ncbi:MAG: hypothetical protein D6729_01355 [Deltaproteobacteria bacterium]|nr:MAG: hypothetical protein D6729_01355 [Deltaproteobacteria bacterium]